MEKNIRRDKITGSRCLSNFFWSICLISGGASFLLAGLSSYFNVNLQVLTSFNELVFIPQGLIMTFYGTIGLLLGIYITLTVFWDIGSGYNEYNKIDDTVKIVRKGFPGKNQEILLTYPLTNIKSIGIEVSESLNPKRRIYLCLTDERQIPLTQTQEPNKIFNLEEEAATLAKFLDLNLETI